MNIVFVCTGNTCRSPMAEAILKKYAEEKNLDIEVSSAGVITADGLPASDNSKEAMRLKDMNIEEFSSRELSREIVDSADIILTMTESHKDAVKHYFNEEDKVFTLSEFSGADGDIQDPYGGPLSLYIECGDEIEKRIVNIIDKLKNRLIRS